MREMPATPARLRRAVTWRSLLLGTLLVPLNSWWIIQMELVRYSAHPTTVSLFFNLIFIVVVLSAANLLTARVRPTWALSQGEILVVYMMCALGSCIASHDMIQVMAMIYTAPMHFISSYPGWQRFMDLLPPDGVVMDTYAADLFYRGQHSVLDPRILSAWAVVIVFWAAVLFLLLFVMQCLNVIIRRQWMENEKLAFPIIQLPLALTENAGTGKLPSLFTRPVFWIGFSLAAGVDLINSLNLYYPSIPGILNPGFGRAFWELGPLITQKPWNAVGWLPISWYPFLIGLGMLLPLDFLFSCWFFFLYWKGWAVLVNAMAWDRDPQFPYAVYQSFGAYAAFFLFSIWLSRGYLARVGKTIFGLSGGMDDRREPIPYRWAAGGVLVGSALLAWVLGRIGLGWWTALAFVGTYLVLSIAITRMRAEMGSPIHDLHYIGADQIWPNMFGHSSYSRSDLMGLTLLYGFNRAYRSHPMPHQLEAMKLAEQTGDTQRRWFWAMLFASLLACLAAFAAMLQLCYHYGASTMINWEFGVEPFARLEAWISTPTRPNVNAGVATVIGMIIAGGLQAMRVRFPWWPFHPLGFAITASWEIHLVWFPLFMAWMIKANILKWGGLGVFRRSLPFFYGLIVGQFVLGSLLNLLGIWAGVPTYQFWQ